jgi:prevent-host-death family protein
MQKYSMTEINNNLSAVMLMMEKTGTPVELTQSGKTIAILLSKDEYDELTKPKLSPWNALMAFREKENIESLNIDTTIFDERQAQNG